jgi:hypothetical protein
LLVSKPHMKKLCLARSDLLRPADLCGSLLDLESLDVTDTDIATSDQIVTAILTSLQHGRALRILHVGGLLDASHAHRLLGVSYPGNSIQIVGAASRMLSADIREKLAKLYA